MLKKCFPPVISTLLKNQILYSINICSLITVYFDEWASAPHISKCIFNFIIRTNHICHKGFIHHHFAQFKKHISISFCILTDNSTQYLLNCYIKRKRYVYNMMLWLQSLLKAGTTFTFLRSSCELQLFIDHIIT